MNKVICSLLVMLAAASFTSCKKEKAVTKPDPFAGDWYIGASQVPGMFGSKYYVHVKKNNVTSMVEGGLDTKSFISLVPAGNGKYFIRPQVLSTYGFDIYQPVPYTFWQLMAITGSESQQFLIEEVSASPKYCRIRSAKEPNKLLTSYLAGGSFWSVTFSAASASNEQNQIWILEK